MSQSGAVTLGSLTRDRLVIGCRVEECDLQGDYPVSALIERFGPDMGLVDLLVELSPDCERRGKMHDPCRAYWPGLREMLGE